ncbi:alkylated DNA repair protein ALKBH8 homolog isoform X1 [Cynara cardunculus var. scolymus]|uniref:alkylated DNA repair protein ALKBH8 homolog isoform X1 n=1 Tax=Cynara cardunculus var. scolymus TaxID=59895 RepID=UPI000D62EF33|nr:alkylated DNA repair protein ALKBH8 homolog isoform X1 [Cynara cardunculus var. scolymus]XP_024984935.1 alkylated DNA repair protein ALKBH8 homolog isoform X1 [Cynara cardunculus var. scolymus]
MGLPKFTRPKGGHDELSSNLYVANCGPAVGLTLASIASAFSSYGIVKGVYPADESGCRVIVSYHDESSAQAALEALNRHPCPDLGGRSLHICYSVQRPLCQAVATDSVQVSLGASELNIPGIYLIHDFVSAQEEEQLLAAVDARPWHSLAKRRVQHYGYEFCYDIRNVNTQQQLGDLPSFVACILEKVPLFKKLDEAADVSLDQLTVNEYPAGVGLSPHIDTHSAFEGSIYSLSLSGPCIMEFRGYSDISSASVSDRDTESSDNTSSFVRRAIYLPPRSMLLLSGEGRYAWQHYIPHHKVDMVKDTMIRRGSKRVSFTFRKVRKGPCQCSYPRFCNSRGKTRD